MVGSSTGQALSPPNLMEKKMELHDYVGLMEGRGDLVSRLRWRM